MTFLLIYILENPNEEGGYTLNGLPALIPIIFWFILMVGFELFFGATIGNLIMKLKPMPINEDDRRLTFMESFVRHIADPIDMMFFGLVGILTIMKTEKGQRVGDLWSNTILIKINKR